MHDFMVMSVNIVHNVCMTFDTTVSGMIYGRFIYNPVDITIGINHFDVDVCYHNHCLACCDHIVTIYSKNFNFGCFSAQCVRTQLSIIEIHFIKTDNLST